jgi:cardiolipin synthase (CMP-forming)
VSLRWLPNAICIGRLLLVAPLVALLLREHYAAALALIVVAGASDALDGFLAKTFGWRTRLGSLLDPAADKLLLVSVFFTLTYLSLVPLALTVVVVMRDVVIVLGALIYHLLVAPIRGEPTAISKLNTACQLSFVLFTITYAAFAWPAPIVLTLLGAAVFFTSVTSGLHYVHSWGRRVREVRQAAT